MKFFELLADQLGIMKEPAEWTSRAALDMFGAATIAAYKNSTSIKQVKRAPKIICFILVSCGLDAR